MICLKCFASPDEQSRPGFSGTAFLFFKKRHETRKHPRKDEAVSNASFCTDVGEQTLDLGIGHGVPLGEVAHGGPQLPVRSAGGQEGTVFRR